MSDVYTRYQLVVVRGNCSSASNQGDEVFSEPLPQIVQQVPMIFLNGALLHGCGDGTKTDEVYWSTDGGATAQPIEDVTIGAKLYAGAAFGRTVDSNDKIYITFWGMV